jgi:hypothetical protein
VTGHGQFQAAKPLCKHKGKHAVTEHWDVTRRVCTRCVLVLCIIGLSCGGAARAAALGKTYTNPTQHFSFEYPASWLSIPGSLDNVQLAVGITAGVAVVSPDLRAGFDVLVKPSASTIGQMEAAATRLLQDHLMVIGTLTYRTSKDQAGRTVVTAVVQPPASGTDPTQFNVVENLGVDQTPTVTFSLSMVSTVQRTLFIGTSSFVKPIAASTADDQDLRAVAGSLRYAGSASTAVPPGPPGIPIAAAGDGAVALRWSPPTSDGGSAITSYAVLWSEGASGAVKSATLSSSTASTDTVTGLLNGHTYKFAVEAKNSAGMGPATPWVAASPSSSAPPLPPGDLSASVKANPAYVLTAPPGTVTLHWSKPAAGDCMTGRCTLHGHHPRRRRCRPRGVDHDHRRAGAAGPGGNPQRYDVLLHGESGQRRRDQYRFERSLRDSRTGAGSAGQPRGHQ